MRLTLHMASGVSLFTGTGLVCLAAVLAEMVDLAIGRLLLPVTAPPAIP